MLTVAQLIIDHLSKLDQKAVVVIDGKLVEGVEGPISGRIKEGHSGNYFTPVSSGRDKAVFFTRVVEGSDGEYRPTRL